MPESCISSNLLTYRSSIYECECEGNRGYDPCCFQAGTKQQRSPDLSVTFCGEGQGQFTCLYMHLD